jgi:hypothetical protein
MKRTSVHTDKETRNSLRALAALLDMTMEECLRIMVRNSLAAAIQGAGTESLAAPAGTGLTP